MIAVAERITHTEVRKSEKPIAPDMSAFYRWHYNTGKKFDSTDLSRTRLLRRLHLTVLSLQDKDVVIDLASGPQALERQYLSDYQKANRPNIRLISVDFAQIERYQLLAKDSEVVNHIRADGTKLPIADRAAAALVCNMGLEYMPETAIREIHRVLQPGGNAHLNLWTQSESWLDDPETSTPYPGGRRAPKALKEKAFWSNFLKRNPSKLIGMKPKGVKKLFRSYGFKINKIQEISDNETSWLEVDLTKTETDVSDKVGGRLVSALIAERRRNRSLPDHQKRVAGIARKLSRYEGLFDPFDRTKRLDVTRLIATIDRGVYN